MILFLNPNSSEHMTNGIVATAREVLPGVRIEGRTNHGAPAAIQGAEDGAAAVPGLLAQLEAARATKNSRFSSEKDNITTFNMSC